LLREQRVQPHGLHAELLRQEQHLQPRTLRSNSRGSSRDRHRRNGPRLCCDRRASGLEAAVHRHLRRLHSAEMDR
jgi:hypothetical protein